MTSEATSGSDLLTVEEAATFLRLKPSTIRDWVLRRRIPYCKISRLVRIRRSDCEALIAASLVPANTPVSGNERSGTRGDSDVSAH